MTSDWEDRYSRQIRLPEMGKDAQRRLGKSRAAVIGCGALGTHAAELLVRAGVGDLLLVDRDFVEESNLPRQSLFTESDARAALPKAVAAAEKLKKINSFCNIRAEVRHVDAGNIRQWIRGRDCILDGADNFETRYLLNDAAVESGVPWVYAGVLGATGMSLAVRPGRTPCLRCLFDRPPPVEETPSCESAGVWGPAVAMVTAFQAGEALKILCGRTELLSGKFFQFDIFRGRFALMDVSASRVEDCPCCGRNDWPYLNGTRGRETTRLCGNDAVQILPAEPRKVDLERMAENLSGSEILAANAYLLRVRADETVLTLFADGRILVQNVTDENRARSLADRFIGG